MIYMFFINVYCDMLIKIQNNISGLHIDRSDKYIDIEINILRYSIDIYT